MKKMKQILAGLLVAFMLVAGTAIAPVSAEASETETVVNGENGDIYVSDETNLKFSNYWTTDEKKAPTRAGYVFGGWYTQDGESMKAIKESEGTSVTSAYAKFVPAEVLSVRAQLQVETETGNGNTESTYLRLLSAVNGLDYQKVGFDIYYNKKHHETSETASNIIKVFSTITNSETGSQAITPDTVFGEAATHFSVLRLADIKQKNYEYVIYVTPQWTTLDGTLVKGQAKYVRVMDGYASNRYISVPVNFTEGSDVAAGQIELKYDATKVQLVTTEGKGFDTGLIMPEMNYYDDGNGTIKIVGNVNNKTDVAPDSNIFANLWFTAKDTVADGTNLSFTFDDTKNEFCTWEEEWATTPVIAEDVKYLK